MSSIESFRNLRITTFPEQQKGSQKNEVSPQSNDNLRILLTPPHANPKNPPSPIILLNRSSSFSNQSSSSPMPKGKTFTHITCEKAETTNEQEVNEINSPISPISPIQKESQSEYSSSGYSSLDEMDNNDNNDNMAIEKKTGINYHIEPSETEPPYFRRTLETIEIFELVEHIQADSKELEQMLKGNPFDEATVALNQQIIDRVKLLRASFSKEEEWKDYVGNLILFSPKLRETIEIFELVENIRADSIKLEQMLLKGNPFDEATVALNQQIIDRVKLLRASFSKEEEWEDYVGNLILFSPKLRETILEYSSPSIDTKENHFECS